MRATKTHCGKIYYGKMHLQRCMVRPYPGRHYGATWAACNLPGGAGAPAYTTAHVRLVTCKTCLCMARRAQVL